MNRFLIFLLSIIAVVALGRESLWGQAASTSQITGMVKDQTGAVLPGAEVTATQTDTGAKRTVVSDETGSYILTNLPIGPYRLEVALPGFRTYVQTGIILQVTPHITNNRQILLTVHAERSIVTPASADLGYVIDKQRADNELLVGDGETAVIGGLTDSHVNQDKTGIPILVDLPFIGKLFGETRTEETKDDLIILVTPHIVDEGEALGAPGTER